MAHCVRFLALQFLVLESLSQSVVHLSAKRIHLDLKHDSDQWVIDEQNNNIVSCSIDIPLLCIHNNRMQIKPSITLVYDNKPYDFSNNSDWDKINIIRHSTKYNNTDRRRLGLGLGLGIRDVLKTAETASNLHHLSSSLSDATRSIRRHRRRRRYGRRHELFDGLIGRTRDAIIQMRMRRGLCVHPNCATGMNPMMRNPMMYGRRRLIDIASNDFIFEKCVMNQNVHNAWMCLIYDYYEDALSVDYSVFNGDVFNIGLLGLVESNEWFINDMDSMQEYQCKIIANYSVCFQAFNIVIDAITLNLMEDTNWSFIVEINNNIELFCYNISNTAKLCVELDMNSNAKLNKIVIEELKAV